MFHWFATVRIKLRWRNYVRRRKISSAALTSVIALVALHAAEMDPPVVRSDNDDDDDDDDQAANRDSMRTSSRNEPFASTSENAPFAEGGDTPLMPPLDDAAGRQHTIPLLGPGTNEDTLSVDFHTPATIPLSKVPSRSCSDSFLDSASIDRDKSEIPHTPSDDDLTVDVSGFAN